MRSSCGLVLGHGRTFQMHARTHISRLALQAPMVERVWLKWREPNINGTAGACMSVCHNHRPKFQFLSCNFSSRESWSPHSISAKLAAVSTFEVEEETDNERGNPSNALLIGCFREFQDLSMLLNSYLHA